MSIFYSRIYKENFADYSDDCSENRKHIIALLEKRKNNHNYKFSNEFLFDIVRHSNHFCAADFHIDLFKNELRKRIKEKADYKSIFLSINDKAGLEKYLKVTYGYLVYLLYKHKLYTEFSIPKKSGGIRKIYAPNLLLESIQRKILIALRGIHSSTSISHGFELGKNIITNAEKHVKKKFVYNIDLKDFFPSINYGRVFGMYFNYFKFEKEIATILAQICTYNGFLPQGAPTSPIISNIICFSMDIELKNIAKLNNLSFTRYADDITFSSRFFPISNEFKESVKKIIKKHGFEINKEKERQQHSNIRQEVTGLIVNRKVNVKRTYIRQIRAILHSCSKNGVKKAEEFFNLKYPNVNFKASLLGKIEYVGAVRGKIDSLYLRYLSEYKSIFNILEKAIKTTNIIIKNKNSLVESNNCNHNPKNLTDFFKSFSEEPFKFLTHDTKDIDIKEKIEECKRHLKNRPFEKRVTGYVFAHVINNLFNLYEYFVTKFENYEEHPMKFKKSKLKTENKINLILKYYKEYPFVFQDLQKENLYFIDLINLFKKSYKFGVSNEDVTDFNFMINSLKYLDKDGKKFEEVFKPINEIKNPPTIYTDIFRFYDALKIIFEQMIKYQKSEKGEKGEIEIRIKRNNDAPPTYSIIIIHLNSKVSKDIEPQDLIRGDFSNVKDRLWSVCDWQILTEFENSGKIYLINILKENKKEPFVETSFEDKPGFTNIFTFYK